MPRDELGAVEYINDTRDNDTGGRDRNQDSEDSNSPDTGDAKNQDTKDTKNIDTENNENSDSNGIRPDLADNEVTEDNVFNTVTEVPTEANDSIEDPSNDAITENEEPGTQDKIETITNNEDVNENEDNEQDTLEDGKKEVVPSQTTKSPGPSPEFDITAYYDTENTDPVLVDDEEQSDISVDNKDDLDQSEDNEAPLKDLQAEGDEVIKSSVKEPDTFASDDPEDLGVSSDSAVTPEGDTLTGGGAGPVEGAVLSPGGTTAGTPLYPIHPNIVIQ